MSTESSTAVSINQPSSFRWASRLVNSTVGGKYLVGVTGLLLTGFVLFHMLGNLQVFLGRDAFNRYAHGMKSLGPLLWLARGGLLTVFAVHIFVALRLKWRSHNARLIGYVFERTVQASLPSRYMVLTGLTILAFVIFHIAHFTLGIVDQVRVKGMGESINYLNLEDPSWKDPTDPLATRHDAYRMFIDGFRNVPVAVLYVICQLLLAMHLSHGVRSMFQTFGINSDKINRPIVMFGWGVTAAIAVGNILMPVAVACRLIGAEIT